jgi:hypothetical protein
MKKAILLGGLLLSLMSSTAMAATTIGRIHFVGVSPALKVGTSYQSRIRFSIIGTCGDDQEAKLRWFSVISGTKTQEIANYRNLHDTLLNAFRNSDNDTYVQLDGISCDAVPTNGNMPIKNVQLGTLH